MAVRSYKPTTPSQRFTTSVIRAELEKSTGKKKPPRKLIKPIKKSGGRNVYGRITSFQRGGGHKRRYRVIDFLRNKKEIPGKVATIEYDPNRSCYIALLHYEDGEKRYILAPQNLKIGSKVIASDQADIQPGNHLKLSALPLGTLIHNVELLPGKGGKVARSAGQFAQLAAKDGLYCQVKMPSGEIRRVHRDCSASVGQLSNPDHENASLGKAGRSRWLGRRPVVRGVVMNPVDHPMGGGEGRASGGHPRSPWGQSAKGLKTRNNRRTNRFIVKRRKRGK